MPTQLSWLYEEVVLAADLVRANGWNGVRSVTQEAQELSQLLRQARLHPEQDRPATFRSPDSVQRKTYDLATQRDGYTGLPTRGNRLDKPVIDAFVADPDGMSRRAAIIREALLEGVVPSDDLEVDEIEAVAHEGRLIPTLLLRRERSRTLRAQKIASVSKAGHAICCEVCSFDFGAAYGLRGAGYIEVHHVAPLHVVGESDTGLLDLALVCANCHRMLHRGPLLTPSELAALTS